MTLEEAQKIAEIFDKADGGCEFCAYLLREQAQDIFPEFNWGPEYNTPVTINEGTQ